MNAGNHKSRHGRIPAVFLNLSLPVSLAISVLLGFSTAAAAGDFDGSKPVLCSVFTVTECTATDGCIAVTPESVAVPRFLVVDFEKKIVKPAGTDGGKRSSDIKRTDRIGGQLIIQGADEGIQDVRDSVGWTAAVAEETGKFVVAAAGNEVAFIVHGACIPMP